MENDFVLETVLTCLDFASACRLLGCEVDTWRDRFTWIEGYKKKLVLHAGHAAPALERFIGSSICFKPVAWPSGACSIMDTRGYIHHIDKDAHRTYSKRYSKINSVASGHGIVVVVTNEAVLLHAEGAGVSQAITTVHDPYVPRVFVVSDVCIMTLTPTGLVQNGQEVTIELKVFTQTQTQHKVWAMTAEMDRIEPLTSYGYTDCGNGILFQDQRKLCHIDKTLTERVIHTFDTDIFVFLHSGAVTAVTLESGDVCILRDLHVIRVYREFVPILAVGLGIPPAPEGDFFFHADRYFCVNPTEDAKGKQHIIDLHTGVSTWHAKPQHCSQQPLTQLPQFCVTMKPDFGVTYFASHPI